MVSFSRHDLIVPFAVKSLSPEFDLRHLRLWDPHTSGVVSAVDLGMDLQPFLSRGSGKEVDDHLQAGERLPSPVLTDEGEQAVFDLVPLARTGRKVTDRDGQPGLVRQPLQLQFPQSDSGPVTAATVGGDQEPLRPRVFLLAHRTPPAPDGFHRERGGIMIDSHADPSGVVCQIVYPVGRSAPQYRYHEIMHANLFRSPLPPPLLPSVFEISH